MVFWNIVSKSTMNYSGVLLLVILILAITSLNTGLMTDGNSKDRDKNFCTFQ